MATTVTCQPLDKLSRETARARYDARSTQHIQYIICHTFACGDTSRHIHVQCNQHCSDGAADLGCDRTVCVHCVKRERHGGELTSTQHRRNASKLVPAAAPGRHRHSVTRAQSLAQQQQLTQQRRHAQRASMVTPLFTARLRAAYPCKWCCARDKNVDPCVKHETSMTF